VVRAVRVSGSWRDASMWRPGGVRDGDYGLALVEPTAFVSKRFEAKSPRWAAH
jgi:hypothetical protein